MSTETIETPDAPSQADLDWWADVSHEDDPGHDPDMPTADVPGVAPPGEEGDDPGWDERAALSAWLDRYESGWV